MGVFDLSRGCLRSFSAIDVRLMNLPLTQVTLNLMLSTAALSTAKQQDLFNYFTQQRILAILANELQQSTQWQARLADLRSQFQTGRQVPAQ